MFGLGMPEILLILAIALIVIGPKKLPDLAKTLGRAMGEFKKSAQDFKRSIDIETTVKDIKDIDSSDTDLKTVVRQTHQNETAPTDEAEVTRPEDLHENYTDNADNDDASAFDDSASEKTSDSEKNGTLQKQ